MSTLVPTVITTARNMNALAATIQRMVDLPDSAFINSTGLIKDCLRDAVKVLEMTGHDLTVKVCSNMATEVLDGQS